MTASLTALKARALMNAVRRSPPWATALLTVLGAALVALEVWGALRGLHFLAGFGEVGLAVARRLLDTALTVLAAGVAFSAVTVAIQTLYLSEDLNFLLALPIRPGRVFALKVTETFLNTALVASALTLPLLLALGVNARAPGWFYPLAALAALLAYALPVGLGCALAVALMRVAPLSRVREVATALGVIMSAALVFVIRAARPEVLLREAQEPGGLDQLLHRFGAPQAPLLPSSWASETVWAAAGGHLSVWLLPLLTGSALVLAGATWLASHAYQAGWARGLESSRPRLDPTARPSTPLERLALRLGPGALIALKDFRLAQRDPTQWSQLLVLVALAGVYLVSLRGVPTLTPQFADVVGYIQLAFQGFVIAGVGVRLAFPAVSLEGRAYWWLRTGPISAWSVLRAKYLGVLPVTLIMALGLGLAASRTLHLSAAVTLAGVLVSVSGALVITALGVGLGAALPRFTADNPAEIGLSPGGLLFMGLSLLFSVLQLLLLARAASLAVLLPTQYPGLSAYATLAGVLGLAGWLLVTVLGTWAPLAWGARRLEALE